MARRGGSKPRSRTAGATDAVVFTGLEELASRANVVALGVAAEALRALIRPEFDAMVREAPRNTGAFVAGLKYTETEHGAKYTSRRPYTRYIHWAPSRKSQRTLTGGRQTFHRGMYVWWHYADEVTIGAQMHADDVAERVLEALDNAS